jgi:hypothetical protein
MFEDTERRTVTIDRFLVNAGRNVLFVADRSIVAWEFMPTCGPTLA